MNRRAGILLMAGLLASLAACGGSGVTAPPATVAPVAVVTPTPAVTATPGANASAAVDPIPSVAPPAGSAPFHAVPGDSVLVSGTATCRFAAGPEGAGGSGWIANCTLDMSDPRVSGSERQAGFRFLVESKQPTGLVFVADECSVTTDGGSWRGSVQGTDDWDVGAILEGHYVGEGAYAGLEFHYYIADQAGGPTRVLGWISGGG